MVAVEMETGCGFDQLALFMDRFMPGHNEPWTHSEELKLLNVI